MPAPAALPGLLVVAGPPRSGISLVASQLARHPNSLLIDAGPEGLAWLRAWLLDPAAPPPEDALRDAYGGQGPPKQPQWLVWAAHGLLEHADVLSQLVEAARSRRIRWLSVFREQEACAGSAARFPHLMPDLPSPFVDPLGFQDAFTLVWRRQHATAEQMADTLPSCSVSYEQLVQHPEQHLQRLWGELGLLSLPTAPPLRGISRSLCFRERPLDQAGIGVLPLDPARPTAVPEPLLLATGRGGSGTRLLSDALLALGLDLGERLNPMGDSIQWADLLYEISLGVLSGRARALRGGWPELLRHRAAALGCGQGGVWGFKLPELMLMLDPALEAWPNTKLVHLVRHPLDVCLRRTHMTSRLNNPIGRATLRQAYRRYGFVKPPEADPPWWHNAVSWRYQLELLQQAKQRDPGRFVELRFEDLCDQPQACADQLAQQLGLAHQPVNLEVMPARRRTWELDDPRVEQVWSFCGALASGYGYGLEAHSARNASAFDG